MDEEGSGANKVSHPGGGPTWRAGGTDKMWVRPWVRGPRRRPPTPPPRSATAAPPSAIAPRSAIAHIRTRIREEGEAPRAGRAEWEKGEGARGGHGQEEGRRAQPDRRRGVR